MRIPCRARLLVAFCIALPLAFCGSAVAAPPSNDNFVDAQQITKPGFYEGTVLEATAELGDRPILGHTPRRPVWFRYKSRCTCEHTVDTGGSGFDTVLAVYAGSSLDDLTLLGADDDASHLGHYGANVRFFPKKDTNYYFAVDSYYTDVPPEASKVELTVSDGSIDGKGVTMTVKDGQTVGSLRSSGLKLVASARRAIGVRIELLVTKRTARRLHLDSTLLGKLSGHLEYKRTVSASVSLTSAARRALQGRSSLTATLRLTLKNNAPHRVLRVPVRLGD